MGRKRKRMLIMHRKSRLQAMLTGEEWQPAEPEQAIEEPELSNSEMIELVKEQAEPEFEIQMEDPSPALNFEELSEELVEEKIDLKKMRKVDLLAMALDMGLAVSSKNTKRQIIAAIEK